MKKPSNIVVLLILTISFAISAFAQDNQPKNNQAKTEMFGKIAKMSQTKKPEDQDKAYQMSKEFLSKYGTDDDAQVKKIRDFVEKYKYAAFNKKLDELKFADAFMLGKEILAKEPENTYIIINLAYGGYDAFEKKKDKTFTADSLNYAKQALSLMEAGKLPATFAPFKDQAEATAIMYYVIGTIKLDSDAIDAGNNFYKALQFESQIKNTSYPYYGVAYGYEKSYEKLATEFQAKVAGKAPEAELTAMQAKLEKITDRMLDAYARAIKIAETDNNPAKDEWKQRFTQIYKYLKQSDAGLDEYLNSALSKPFPNPQAI